MWLPWVETRRLRALSSGVWAARDGVDPPACPHVALRTAGLGGTPLPKRDLHRFVKWPQYVRLQRQKRVLSMRLKVPPIVNQFVTRALDKNTAETAFKLLLKYKPEDKKQKAERLKAEAAAREAGKEVGGPHSHPHTQALWWWTFHTAYVAVGPRCYGHGRPSPTTFRSTVQGVDVPGPYWPHAFFARWHTCMEARGHARGPI